MARLSEIMKSTNRIDLEFVDLIQDEASRDGSPIVKLILAKPIPIVYGRNIVDNASGQTVKLEASDVDMISIGKEGLDVIDALEAEAEKNGTPPVFTWKVEGKSGTLKCNLKLDVSQSLDVWVVKTSLRQFGINSRNTRRAERNSALAVEMQERRARRELAGTDVTNTGDTKPEPTDGGGAGATKPKKETAKA